MGNAFSQLIEQFDEPALKIEKIKQTEKKIVEQEERTEYIQITEKFRKKINQEKDLACKLKLCLELIYKLTGDEVFYKQNAKLIQENDDILKKYMISQFTHVFWVDLQRRMDIHRRYLEIEKTPLNEYLYLKSKNDFELAHYRYQHIEDPSEEGVMKIKELEKTQKELEDMYKSLIE